MAFAASAFSVSRHVPENVVEAVNSLLYTCWNGAEVVFTFKDLCEVLEQAGDFTSIRFLVPSSLFLFYKQAGWEVSCDNNFFSRLRNFGPFDEELLNTKFTFRIRE